MQQLTINDDLALRLTGFIRNEAGTPQYSKGLRQLNVTIELSIYCEYPDNLADIAETPIRDAITTYLGVETTKFDYATVIDNDDAFLRNMIPPHAHQQLNGMFTDEYPMLFTQDIAPPPIRLNMPMLVGRNEASLMDDMQIMFVSYFSANMPNIGLRVEGISFNPVRMVSVSPIIASWVD